MSEVAESTPSPDDLPSTGSGVYHVETRQVVSYDPILIDGQWRSAPLEWRPFTAAPIEGRAAAEEHLAMVRDFARDHKQRPEDIRIRELTDDEVRGSIITRYRAAMERYLLSHNPEQLRDIAQKFRPLRAKEVG